MARATRILVRGPLTPAGSARRGWKKATDFNLDEDIGGQLERLFPEVAGSREYDAFLKSTTGTMQAATFGLRSDGAILSLDPRKPRSVTARDIIRGCEEGYNDGRPSAIYLQVGPFGRGNGYVDWNTILSFAADESVRLFFDAACLAIIAKSKGMIDGVRYGKERAVAEIWVSEQGIDSPRTLRRVVDRKERWKPKSLAVRLQITKKFAKDLLRRVGYAQAYSGAPWCRSDEPDALRRRADWIEMERPKPRTDPKDP